MSFYTLPTEDWRLDDPAYLRTNAAYLRTNVLLCFFEAVHAALAHHRQFDASYGLMRQMVAAKLYVEPK